MKHVLTTLILVSVAMPAALCAAERATPAEAQAMLQKAVAHYKAVGRAQALADFSSGKPPFRDRDLYVVCISADHRISAHGAMAAYVGMSPDVLKDATGKPLGGAVVSSVGTKGEGSLSFPMTNPMTGKTESKTMWTQKIGDDVCGVGAYKP